MDVHAQWLRNFVRVACSPNGKTQGLVYDLEATGERFNAVAVQGNVDSGHIENGCSLFVENHRIIRDRFYIYRDY